MLGVVVDQLFRTWRYDDEQHVVRVFTVGKQLANNPNPRSQVSVSQQLTWENHILPFIYRRFNNYYDYKRNVEQWDNTAKALLRRVGAAPSQQSFVDQCLAIMF